MTMDTSVEKPVRKSRHKISRHAQEAVGVLSGVPGLTPAQQVERVTAAQRSLSKALGESAELLGFVNDRATTAAQAALAERSSRRDVKAQFQALLDSLEA